MRAPPVRAALVVALLLASAVAAATAQQQQQQVSHCQQAMLVLYRAYRADCGARTSMCRPK